jgi:hypothetical protein
MMLGGSGPGTQGALPAPGGYIVFWCPQPGVIVYRKRQGGYDEARERAGAPTRRTVSWHIDADTVAVLGTAAMALVILIATRGAGLAPGAAVIPGGLRNGAAPPEA